MTQTTPNAVGVDLIPVDLVVETANHEYLDRTVQQLGPAAVVDGSWDGRICRVRVVGRDAARWIRSAIDDQRYGRVVSEEQIAGVAVVPLEPVDLEPVEHDPELDPLQCHHYGCRAEEVPGAARDCAQAFDACCGCCGPDGDTLWEIRQEGL